MASPERDTVQHIHAQWTQQRPDLDTTPLLVVGRLSRLSRLVDRHLLENYARFDLEEWAYDVLATLRRQGEPFALTAGDLVRQCMVTTGAITNRIDRLVARGLVERVAVAGDRRKVLVQLTADGRSLVDQVTGPHLATEAELLRSLSPTQQATLAKLLRTVLLDLGDIPDTES